MGLVRVICLRVAVRTHTPRFLFLATLVATLLGTTDDDLSGEPDADGGGCVCRYSPLREREEDKAWARWASRQCHSFFATNLESQGPEQRNLRTAPRVAPLGSARPHRDLDCSMTMSKELIVAAAFGVTTWLFIEGVKRKNRRTAWVAGKDWLEKRATFSKLTADHLLVITDFDATITCGDSEQCHDVMGNSKLLSSEFRREFAPLLDW